MKDVTQIVEASRRDDKFLEDVLKELERARKKFPHQDWRTTALALTEEVGEMAQALLQYHYEPCKGKTTADIYAEAVQVAVTVMRVALDCDFFARPVSE